ncbi:LOW QUALITY PROTEIN: uncharacterized protein RBU47_011577 [Passerculus sandwichensis]
MQICRSGPNPQVSKGTHVLVPLGDSSPTGWRAELDEGVAEPLRGVAGSDHALWVGLTAPPTAPIGRYRLSVRTRTEVGEFAAPFEADNDVVVLFNPWCPEDSVYMEKTSELSEYVLNESGRIFYGTEEQIAERHWNYGQFEPGVLEACLYILERRGMPQNFTQILAIFVSRLFGGDKILKFNLFCVFQVDYGATAEELEAHFHGCGSVNRVTILCDKYSGHPKGFAYIEFSDKESVRTSMALDESLFRGRQIKVIPKRTNRPGISSTDRGFPRGRFRGRGGGYGSARSRFYSGYARPRARYRSGTGQKSTILGFFDVSAFLR